MDEPQRRVLESIELAFCGVELGDGVSLHETHVIDNYGTPEQRSAARAPDEKRDWRKLTDDPDLPRYCGLGYSGLSFFDAAGLRFHLPACLSRAVKDPEDEAIGNMMESLLFQLTHLDDYQRRRFAILDARQRGCVREVLLYFRDVLEFEDTALDQAIAGYWSQGAQGEFHSPTGATHGEPGAPADQPRE